MSIDETIDTYHNISPETFNAPPLPPNWESEWDTVVIEAPFEQTPSNLEELFAGQIGEKPGLDHKYEEARVSSVNLIRFPDRFPGMPIEDYNPGGGGGVPPAPADAYAFYLPFHLYRNRGWGIYLIAERVVELARHFFNECHPHLTEDEATVATRLYLYEHEYFHYKAEMFSVGLEASHRKRIYLDGQRPLYFRTKGSDNHLEEALAEAYALRRVRKHLKGAWSEKKRLAFMTVLTEFVRCSGPGYQVGAEIYEDGTFRKKRHVLSEQIMSASPVDVPSKSPEIWEINGHNFRGLANVLSNIKYLIPVGHPLAHRSPMSVV